MRFILKSLYWYFDRQIDAQNTTNYSSKTMRISRYKTEKILFKSLQGRGFLSLRLQGYFPRFQIRANLRSVLVLRALIVLWQKQQNSVLPALLRIHRLLGLSVETHSQRIEPMYNESF